MRITKSIAEYVAKQMVSEKKGLLQEKKDALKATCTEMYKRQIPKEVLSLWKNTPVWLKTTYSVRLNGDGFSYECQDIEELPHPNNREPFLSFENCISIPAISKLKVLLILAGLTKLYQTQPIEI